MKIFFDTEFTGLHKNTTLISLGCVDEDGRTFYAELSDYDQTQCDEWIKKNVIENLISKDPYVAHPACASIGDDGSMNVWGNKECVKEYLNQWLSIYDDVQLVSDVCHYDMVLFIDLFGGAFDLPSQINPACHDINQDIARYYDISEKEAFDKSREGILDTRIEGDKHNSLYDAKVIRAIYKQLKYYSNENL